MNENTIQVQENNQNFYEILGLTKESSFDDIKKAYKTLALQKHPDKGGNTKEFSLLQHAFNTLKDSNTRKKYDDSLPHEPNVSVRVKHSWKRFNKLEPINIQYTRKMLCCLCNGNGYITHFVNDIFIETCIVCSGYGKLYTHLNKKTPMPCFNCSGIGKVCIDNQNIISHTHQCNECKGERFVMEDNNIFISVHDYIQNEENGKFSLKGFGNYFSTYSSHIFNEGYQTPFNAIHNGCSVGDLFIFVEEENNDTDIKRVGYDLYVNKYVTFADCMFGGILSIINPLTEKTLKRNIDSLINSDGIFEHNKLKIILDGEGFTKQDGNKGNIMLQLLLIFPDFDIKNKELYIKKYGGITLDSY
jgi:DnaJ-class molecular chaperone